MIQLIFDSKGKIVPEWEGDRERLVFHLAPASVKRNSTIHRQADEAGMSLPDSEAVAAVDLHYEGDMARQVRVILELPDEVWDNLANWADDLLDENLLSDEEDEDLFEEDGQDGEDDY
jgi:hypothetical protein